MRKIIVSIFLVLTFIYSCKPFTIKDNDESIRQNPNDTALFLHEQKSSNIGRWHFIGSIKDLNAYIDMNNIGCKKGDFLITALEDYQGGYSPNGAKSAEVFYLVDTEHNIYFGLHGFDYTEHMGKGRAMHFEFNPNYEQLRESLKNRESWQKARIENVGGAIVQFLLKSGRVCTMDSSDGNSVRDDRTLPLDIPLKR
jgi:hypothetical protein